MIDLPDTEQTAEMLRQLQSIDPNDLTVEQLRVLLDIATVTQRTTTALLADARQRIAELEAQLDAVQTYANYHHYAADLFQIIQGGREILTFDEWWQTPHCPECGRLDPVGAIVEHGALLWMCAGVDGCGHTWSAPQPSTRA